jgi:hypothetical protein
MNNLYIILMLFGSEPRRDLFAKVIKESKFKPDPTAYELEGAFG